MSSSNTTEWVYDYATNQEVRWSDSRRTWLTRTSQPARPPQRAPLRPNPPVPPPGPSRPINMNPVSQLGASMNNLTVGSPSSQPRDLPSMTSGPLRAAPVYTPTSTGPSRTSSSTAHFGAQCPRHPPSIASNPAVVAGPSQPPSSGARSVSQSRSSGFKGTVKDPASGRQTQWDIRPANDYTDPDGLAQRGLGFKYIGPTNASRPDPQRVKFYMRGCVIEVLLVAPPEDSGLSRLTASTDSQQTTRVRKRRFVITADRREDGKSFEALAIKTYDGQGVAAPGVTKFHHTIIYTGKTAPKPKTKEVPRRGSGETPMQQQSIRVRTFDRGEALDKMSRLDYGARWIFDHGYQNIRVFGRVLPDWHAPLFSQYQHVWSIIQRNQAPSVAPPSVTSPPTDAGSTITIRPSGPISLEQMNSQLENYRNHARRRGLTIPAPLTVQNVQILAQNSQAREDYFKRVRQMWSNAAGPSTTNNDDEDDDDDNDDDDAVDDDDEDED